jgi:Seed dormancy control
MEAFYSRWLIEQERILNDLLAVPQDRPDLQIPLISQMLSHCAEYHNARSRLAEEDVFQVFSASWLTPIERSFLWLGGLKPRMIFSFVPLRLNNDQTRQMYQLQRQMVQRQTELEARMRQVEETMMILMALTTVLGPVRNGEARAEAALRVAEIMHAVFNQADRLRKHVVTRIINILGTAQTVSFLVSAANFHISLRRYGFPDAARYLLTSV